MQPNKLNRRDFIQTSAASLAAASVLTSAESAGAKGTLAIHGGTPVRTAKASKWPLIEQTDRDVWMKVLEEGKWCRLDGHFANDFERAYAGRMGTKHCTATANGTSALLTSLNALGVGPGDEVLVPPYTFVATINVVLLQFALPIFIDTDRQTSQMDATKLEAAITPRTKCIIPVHLGGNVCDMDAIMAVAQKHKVHVVEDACQSHFAEWQGKKAGSLGTSGCFSFQVTKNLSGGEGGAIICNDAKFNERCYAFHNNGRGRLGGGFSYPHGGANLRMTEFQAALLLSQMPRVEEQMKVRETNAKYLTEQLEKIPGIQPMKMYPGCTRNAYHLYSFRYDKEQFAGAPRVKFLQAMAAEGAPCSNGYTPLNKQAFLKETLGSRHYKSIYGEDRLAFYWKNSNECPENDKLCEEAVWFGQTTLLGTRSDMDQIAEAVRKIQSHAGELAKS